MRFNLAFLVAVSSASVSFPHNDDSQKPFNSQPDTVETRNFSVGFSLQSSYATAAIIFENSNGKLDTYTRVYEPGILYQEVMARLSLKISQHIAPPYYMEDTRWMDLPRQAARLALKVAHLPASYEVGILGEAIIYLRKQLEKDFNITISEAVFASSKLLALYQDDLEDTACFAGVKYVIPRNQWKVMLWETASSLAGHGLGLCEHWQNETLCHEEYMQLPEYTLFAVHYSRNALTTAIAKVQWALGIWEPTGQSRENFMLGHDSIEKYLDADAYWTDVKEDLLYTLKETPWNARLVSEIMVTGDEVSGEFLNLLERTIRGHLGRDIPIISLNPVDVSARGAAEFMRRGGWNDWKMKGKCPSLRDIYDPDQ